MGILNVLNDAVDLFGTYNSYKTATQATPSLFNWGDVGIPGYDLVPESQTTKTPSGVMPGMVWDPNANCGSGKWIKRRRRRKPRLATKADIKDLASLKGVLGQGKAFELWIATNR